MLERSRLVSILFIFIFLFGAVWTGQATRLHSETQPVLAKVRVHSLVLDNFSGAKILPFGVEVYSGKAVIQVIALQDDVVRIRIARDGILPEDASWAVLPAARQSRASVTPENSDGAVGFRTKSIQVKIDRETLRFSLADLDGNILQEDAADLPVEFHGKSFRIYKQMPLDEHYFGLGDKAGALDRRNQAFTLWNTDAYNFQESTDPLYKSIPFFLTMRGGRSLGMLFDNTWRSSFDFGQEIDGVYSFGAEGGPIDYYLLYGPEPKRVVENYARMTGLPPLPPLWALGYQQSRFSYENETELRQVAGKLRADRIPADALYLDIDYQKDNQPFTVDAGKFPNLVPMLADLKKEDFHVVSITDLHIADLPNAGYGPYDTGSAGGHFVKNPDGSIFVGKVWPGPSVFPDFTDQSTRQWWGTLYSDLVGDGMSGFWNDMNEPSVFDTPDKTMPNDVQHRIAETGFQPRLASHREIHNVYGMENSRATYEGLLKIAPESRPFVLTRATYAGGQRYAATWTGDNSATWNHLRMTTPMLENLGLSGFGMSGADVGGFIGTPSPELLTKWTELATFQPIDRNHSEKGTARREPWVDGAEQENIRRRYIEERYRLMPYLYTAVEEMSRTGLPVLRPLFLEFPDATPDKHPLDIDAGNEFLLGSDLLVAPSPFPEKLDDYAVQLPLLDWYDYWTGERVKRQSSASANKDAVTSLLVHPTLEALPVYVREGSIVPMQSLVQSTSAIPQGPLLLRVYAGENCQGSLYLDDGKTMEYKRGEFLRMHFTCTVAGNSVKVHIGAHEGSYQPWWHEVQVEVYGLDSSASYTVGSGTTASSSPAVMDSAHHKLSVTIPDDGRGSDLEISSRH
ncbi:MAG: TIM-barrel domain-containing protein [Candidatus Sulfotelmatobacter sp.]